MTDTDAKPLTDEELADERLQIQRTRDSDPRFSQHWYPQSWRTARFLATIDERDKRIAILLEAIDLVCGPCDAETDFDDCAAACLECDKFNVCRLVSLNVEDAPND